MYYSWIGQACQFWLGLQLINQKVSEALDSIFPGVHTPNTLAEPVRSCLRSLYFIRKKFFLNHSNRPTRLLAPDTAVWPWPGKGRQTPQRHAQRCWKVAWVAHGPLELVGLGCWALSCCRTSFPTVSRQTLGNASKRRREENQFAKRGEQLGKI